MKLSENVQLYKCISLRQSILLSILLSYPFHAHSEEIDFIERYKGEAHSYVGETSKSELAESVKQTSGFTANPSEKFLSEKDLRTKADDMMKRSGEKEDSVSQAIGAVKSSTANEHRSKHTVVKLQNKDFIKKSNEVTLNPISGLNVAGEADCKVADSDLSGENIKFEEYYVDIVDTRLVKEEKKCEEDQDTLFYCSRMLKDGKCNKKNVCEFNAGGIEDGAIASDMHFTYNYPYLTVGTIANNYWGGTCAIYDRQTKFKIRDLENIKDFKIIQIGFDDYLRIVVNGIQVYNGPYGGNKLEVHRVFAWLSINVGDGKHHSCELNTNWQFDVNIDLIPYLKEGENIIDTRVEVSGAGEGWLKMLVSQYCCAEWEGEVWESDCPVG